MKVKIASHQLGLCNGLRLGTAAIFFALVANTQCLEAQGETAAPDLTMPGVAGPVAAGTHISVRPPVEPLGDPSPESMERFASGKHFTTPRTIHSIRPHHGNIFKGYEYPGNAPKQRKYTGGKPVLPPYRPSAHRVVQTDSHFEPGVIDRADWQSCPDFEKRDDLRVPRALILYDTTGAFAHEGDAFAQYTANLVSHFGEWQAVAVKDYTTGLLDKFEATFYLGSAYDEPLPAAFLKDVRAAIKEKPQKQIVWLKNNIWQLSREMKTFQADMGWMHTEFLVDPISTVVYKGANLTRSPHNDGGMMGINIADTKKAKVLATAWRNDNRTTPWAVRSGNFTYISEMPYAYMDMNDRYLAWCDILFDVLAPKTPERHRAMVRIEDVGPEVSPEAMKAISDVLSSRGIPFSIAAFPIYDDPKGAKSVDKKPESFDLSSRSEMVEALKYAESHGGRIICHGLTHQYGDANMENNPYNGVSGDDFEFYRAHEDANKYVIWSGPVGMDSEEWMLERLRQSVYSFKLAGFNTPVIFEAPHYGASAADYKVVSRHFEKRYCRGLYFPGYWKGQPDYKHHSGMFYPYVVKDVFGCVMAPENIGNVEPEEQNHHPPRFPADLLETARLNKLAIRDGFASCFYHTYLGTDYLVELVDGLKAQGWTFVSAHDIKD